MLKLKYKQKYLKYKNKYLHFKSQIGGSESYLWYVDNNDEKFSLLNINNPTIQQQITKLYNEYLLSKKNICRDSICIEKEIDGNISIKFNKKKLKYIKFDDTKLKEVIKRFTLLQFMKHMEEILFNSFNFTNIDLISIGCENDFFEKLCEQIFGIKILCFNQENIENSLQEYNKSSTKKQHSILLYVSSQSEKNNKAITLLKPLALVKIDKFEYRGHELMLEDTEFTTETEKYIRISQEIKNEPNNKAVISLWINYTLYESFTNPLQIYKFKMLLKIKFINFKKFLS